ncbi:hypothetical protein DFS34DRAFT_591443 [Phlyctochytrium arcticum]|nr:hypothetical protein DFS34DRAFT_591443 [Phlyctochytrium arcticum]
MNSPLELQRKAHEDVERLEEATVGQLLHPLKSQKERLMTEHRVDKLLAQIQSRSQALLDMYVDEEGTRQEEIRAITSGSQDFSEFYGRLRAIKDWHRRYPGGIAETGTELGIDRDAEVEEQELENMFSGEESLGKYFDLHEIFEQYVNLEKAPKVNYLKYLDQFFRFETIPRETKETLMYTKYLNSLQTYFEGFFQRALPLFDADKVRTDAVKRFDEEWERGTLKGWERSAQQSDTNGDAEAALFCVACNKQYSKQTVYSAHLTSKKHKKAAAALVAKGVTEISAEARLEARERKERAERDKLKDIAKMETIVRAYTKELETQREETKAHVERKQTLTTEELVADAEEEVDLSDSDPESDTEKIYNPLKLPLGWDGKPIPYWLYKLHGLGVEYPCEICGNYVYMGRKAFDRHFQEWRHAHGMRCLGITNTRHFHEITSIEDAYALWEKLKDGSKVEQFREDIMEEFEDADGNVFNKKTYEDLKRQGLL